MADVSPAAMVWVVTTTPPLLTWTSASWPPAGTPMTTAKSLSNSGPTMLAVLTAMNSQPR